MTRGSLRSVQSSWPCPTSSATTSRGAALEQDVGEAAGRRADVERPPAGHRDAERVERVRELDAAAPDVRMVRRERARRARRSDGGAGLRDDLAVDGHLSGEDQRARPLARGRAARARPARYPAAPSSSPCAAIRRAAPQTSCRSLTLKDHQFRRLTTQSDQRVEPAVGQICIGQCRVRSLTRIRSPWHARLRGRRARDRSACRAAASLPAVLPSSLALLRRRGCRPRSETRGRSPRPTSGFA